MERPVVAENDSLGKASSSPRSCFECRYRTDVGRGSYCLVWQVLAVACKDACKDASVTRARLFSSVSPNHHCHTEMFTSAAFIRLPNFLHLLTSHRRTPTAFRGTQATHRFRSAIKPIDCGYRKRLLS